MPPAVIAPAILSLFWDVWMRTGAPKAEYVFNAELEAQLASYWRMNPASGPEVERDMWRRRK